MTRRDTSLVLALAVVRAGELRDLIRDVHHGVHVEQGVHVLADARPDAPDPCRCRCSSASARCSGPGRRCRTGRRRCSRPPYSGRSRSRRLAARACRSRTPRRGRNRSQSRGRRDRSRAPRSCPPCRSWKMRSSGMPISVVPDVEGLVVLLVDRGIQPVRFQAHPLGVGQKLPGPVQWPHA